MSKNPNYIFVTGGVISGLGKGITAASIGNLLKARGVKVNIQKCDPYLNVDAGTLNPREHGECFVTADGTETDLDLGHYERFLDQELTRSCSLMSGQVLSKVIKDERAGKYKGDDVQVVPHLTAAIQEYIKEAGKGFDIHIVEIGGTVGDYESLSFIEAIRELGMVVGRKNCLYVHVIYLPYLRTSQEIKTKPAQNSVRDLRGLGITPDILVARSTKPPNQNIKKKLSLFCGVEQDSIILLPNASTIYEVPLTLEDTGIGDIICKKLHKKTEKADLNSWRHVVKLANTKNTDTIKVGVVAKYLDNADTYMSVFEALRAASWWNNTNIDIKWINAEKIEQGKQKDKLYNVHGIVIPGGFGSRGIEGMITAAQYAIERKIPYLGLCLGLQIAIIASARQAGVENANSTEFDLKTINPVIDTLEGQKGKENTGGTMRLGNYPCILDKNSLVYSLYENQEEIIERHRHRYECNNMYRDKYADWNLNIVGTSPNSMLVEIIEGIDHPFFVASQFHPEFKSRPNKPHALFKGFIQACIKNSKTYKEKEFITI